MFVEQDCTVEHEGKQFTSGGAWIAERADKPGHFGGVVYAKPEQGIVTDWHGNKIADAHFGPIWQGNLCKMQCVSFVYEGKRFHGRYCPDWAQAVRVRGR